MCIAYLSLGAHPDWPLLIAANRDEYHARPALPARPWPESPQVIAGRDLSAGGTWLGLNQNGRWGLLTNFRDPASHRDEVLSRGSLVSDFLRSGETARKYTEYVHSRAGHYNGFNLIVGEGPNAWYVGNHAACTGPVLLQPGRYALSNHALDTPWPKVERLRNHLDAALPQGRTLALDSIYEALRDGEPAQDHALPNTGVSLEMERLLSSIFIVSPNYGTRCSTIIALDAQGDGIFSETSYNPAGMPVERHDWPLHVSMQSGGL